MKTLFAIISIAIILLLSGCTEKPPAGNVTTQVFYRGVQCREDPWDGVGFPKEYSAEQLIKSFYKKNNGIEIISVSFLAEPACEACDVCPKSVEYSATILEKDKPKMLELGWREEPNIGPKITLEKTVFWEGDTVDFSFENPLGESVFLPGCNEFTIERFFNGSWQEILPKQCIWEGVGVEIKSGETKKYSYALNDFGTFVVSIEASVGCEKGKPLSQAKCSKTFSFKSNQFTVKGTPTGLEEMQRCPGTPPDKCILVNASCCGCSMGGKRIAINKDFESQYEEKFLGVCRYSTIACPQVISTDPSCRADASAGCVQYKCELDLPPGE